MTVSTTDCRFAYSGDGVTTAFSFPRKVISASDITVYLVDETTDTSTLQTNPTHYTFLGSGLSNGIYATATITFVTAPTSDQQVVIFRDGDLVQEVDFESETDVQAALNRFADRDEMKIQRLSDWLSRSLRMDDGDPATSMGAMPHKALLVNKILGFDSSGNPQAVDNDTSSTIVTATGSSTARMLADWFAGYERNGVLPVALDSYLDLAEGANLHRFRDRVYIDAGADTEGNYTPVSGGTWVRTDVHEGLRYAEKVASLVSYSSLGGHGASFASRMSDNGGAAADGPPIASWHFAYNDAAGTESVWAGYFEARRITGAGRAFGVEIDAVNEGTEGDDLHAYDVGDEDVAVGAWIASGGDPNNTNSNTVYDAAAALAVVNNGARFRKGIVFTNNGLTDRGTNHFEAIELARYQRVSWKYSGGANAYGGMVRGDGSDATRQARLVFGDTGLSVFGVKADLTTETKAFDLIVPAITSTNEYNYLTITNTETGGGVVTVAPAGPDSEVDLKLAAKSSGEVLIETNSTTRVTVDVGVQIGAPTGGDQGAGTLNADTNVFVDGAALWKPVPGGWSNVAVVRNSVNGAGDATETAAATITIPAGLIGANGLVRITWLGSQTNSANVKTWRVRFGGASGTLYYNNAATNSVSTHNQLIIGNRNSASSQIGATSATTTAFNQSTGGVTTSAVNTANAVDIVISNLWAGATSGETMTLERYLVEVLYGA